VRGKIHEQVRTRVWNTTAHLADREIEQLLLRGNIRGAAKVQDRVKKRLARIDYVRRKVWDVILIALPAPPIRWLDR